MSKWVLWRGKDGKVLFMPKSLFGLHGDRRFSQFLPILHYKLLLVVKFLLPSMP